MRIESCHRSGRKILEDVETRITIGGRRRESLEVYHWLVQDILRCTNVGFQGAYMLLEWESSGNRIKLDLFIEDVPGAKAHCSCDSFCKAFIVCR